MKDSFYLVLLSLSGTLFAGYLSAVKLFTKGCALDTGCSYFIGYPTCYYGFAMFLMLFSLSLWYFFFHALKTRILMQGVALMGILFSLYFTVTEVAPMITTGVRYGLFLPTCAYGLMVYLAVLYFARKSA